MSGLALVLGLVVLAALVVDVVSTAIASGLPGGWLTRNLGSAGWKLISKVFGSRHTALQVAGIILVIGLLLAWVVLLVLGWWLVLLGVGEVEHATTGAPASAWQTLYLTGWTITTLGIGDFVPGSGPGQAVTAIASASGILVLTLMITYLVPVLSGVSEKRNLAATLHAIGRSPQEMAERLWPDGSLDANGDVMLDLSEDIRDLTQMHYSYPVLHYFHSRHRRTAVPPSIARLDETLTALLAVREDAADDLAVHLLRQSIDDLLRALEKSFIRPADRVPPAPPVEVATHLTDQAVVGDADPYGDLEPLDERRGLLCGFVEDDGWSWDDVLQADGPDRPLTGR